MNFAPPQIALGLKKIVGGGHPEPSRFSLDRDLAKASKTSHTPSGPLFRTPLQRVDHAEEDPQRENHVALLYFSSAQDGFCVPPELVGP